MPSSSRLPLAVLLLAAIALLLSLSCPVAAAAGNNNYSGGRVLAAAAAAASPKGRWRRRLEEEVAPEFSSLAGAGQQYINYDTLNKDRPACGGGCAAQGLSYTGQHCTYANKCRG